MNRVSISIRRRNLPWRIWSCEANPSWTSKNRGWSATLSRRFASISRAGEERETFDIRCGSSGNVTVEYVILSFSARELGVLDSFALWKGPKYSPCFSPRGDLISLSKSIITNKNSIYNSESLSNPLTPLVIYFPPTGAHLTQDHPPIPKFLSSLPFRTALAQINYRWNIPPLPINRSSGTGDSSSSVIPLSSTPGYNNRRSSSSVLTNISSLTLPKHFH